MEELDANTIEAIGNAIRSEIETVAPEELESRNPLEPEKQPTQQPTPEQLEQYIAEQTRVGLLIGLRAICEMYEVQIAANPKLLKRFRSAIGKVLSRAYERVENSEVPVESLHELGTASTIPRLDSQFDIKNSDGTTTSVTAAVSPVATDYRMNFETVGVSPVAFFNITESLYGIMKSVAIFYRSLYKMDESGIFRKIEKYLCLPKESLQYLIYDDLGNFHPHESFKRRINFVFSERATVPQEQSSTTESATLTTPVDTKECATESDSCCAANCAENCC